LASRAAHAPQTEAADKEASQAAAYGQEEKRGGQQLANGALGRQADLAARFPDSKTVNEALRALVAIEDAMPKRRPRRGAA
jgi:hypothetical protein